MVYKINNNYYYNGYEHIFDNMDLNTAIILSDDDANQFENLPLFTIAGQHYWGQKTKTKFVGENGSMLHPNVQALF